MSPCGRWILVLCYSLERQSWELRSWDIKTNWVGTFPLHLRRGPWPPDPAYPWRPDVSVLQVMPGGLRAIIALEKGEPGLHDLSTGAVLGRFPLQPGPLLSAINTDGNRVLFSGPDDSLRLWQVDPPRELWRIDPRAEIYALSFSLDGNSAFAIVAGGAQVILNWRAWDVGTAQEISPDLAREYCPSPGPHTVRTGPDGIRRQIDWKLNGSLSIRELDGGNDYLLEGQAEPPRDVLFTRDAARVTTVARELTPHAWALFTFDLVSGARSKSFAIPSDGIWDWSATAGLAVVHSGAGSLTVVDLRSSAAIRSIGVGSEPSTLALSPNGRWVLVACEDWLSCWSTASGEKLWETQATAPITLIDVSAGSQRLVTASDATVTVWDLTSGTGLGSFTREGSGPVVITPDGGTVVACEQSGCVHMLQVVE